MMLPPATRVYLACGFTDMRKGFDGLAAQVQTLLSLDPYGGALFVFRGRRGDLLKALHWDGQGLCLYAKRLELPRARFVWPQCSQLRPQVRDLDRRRAELGARRSQFVPQCGDLVLGRAIGQVHTVGLPEDQPPYKRDYPRRPDSPLRRQLRAAPSRPACASRSPPAASTPARSSA